MITAQVESFTERLDELKPILPLHHAELALFQDKMPLDPQFDIYIAREAAGQLSFVTLREQGALIGYWISFIAPGLHYRTTLTATMDILYVHPDHRGAGAGFVLADAVKAELVRRGVKVWWAGSKNHKDIAWFLERLGMAKAEEYYVMWLGE